MRILYVEDEKFLAEAVVYMLKKEHIMIDWVDDGERGLELALNPYYDAIVLDIMLPKLSGLDILKTIRHRDIKTPVIMLSALNEVSNKIAGLEAGADDYLAKPFKVAELVARINAVTRRPPLAKQTTITFADLKYNPKNRTLNNLELTDKEASILEMLLASPESVVDKTRILTHVWGCDAAQEENYVEVYISYLRKKLAAVSQQVEIKTIRSLGYKLVKKHVQ